MPNFTPISSLLPSAILFLLIPHSLGLNDSQKLLVNKICSRTINYRYCVDFFNEHSYGPTTGIKGFTHIAILQTIINATNTLKFIVKRIESERNEVLKNLYKICEVGYENLVNQMRDAHVAFGKEDYRNMIFDIENCDRFVNDCESVMDNQDEASHRRDLRSATQRVTPAMTLQRSSIVPASHRATASRCGHLLLRTNLTL
ncbi:Unknown protein [Striga hermonthica]|uniref:Pectinesterase inhibitor domain-containing protein n=1 Tax=Striga hermonthica TaxID=68872 RepID=A0A9N7QZ93_STRHE|nr:Unknown protein [Striga hermonthica]